MIESAAPQSLCIVHKPKLLVLAIANQTTRLLEPYAGAEMNPAFHSWFVKSIKAHDNSPPQRFFSRVLKRLCRLAMDEEKHVLQNVESALTEIDKRMADNELVGRRISPWRTYMDLWRAHM